MQGRGSVLLEGGQSRWLPVGTGLRARLSFITTPLQHLRDGDDGEVRRERVGGEDGWVSGAEG